MKSDFKKELKTLIEVDYQLTMNTKEQKSEVVIYRAEDGRTAIDVRLEDETVWLTQSQMVKLFKRDQSVISRHIRNTFREGELDEKSNMHFLHIPPSDKPVAFFNLNVIISVGDRVKSKRGTQFRIWAANILRDHLIKGYTVNKKQLERSTANIAELQKTISLITSVRDRLKVAVDPRPTLWITQTVYY